MRKAFPLLVLALALVMPAAAQTFEEYLKLRSRFGITQSTGVEALETLAGKRTLEVRGVVTGSMAVDGRTFLMLKAADGGNLEVEAQDPPDWLVGNAVPARLLVTAERVGGELRARLSGAAADSRMASHESRLKALSAHAATKAPRSKTKDWQLPGSDALPYYEAFIRGRNPRLSAAEARRIAQGVIGFSIRYGVDARLIMAMVLVESGFNPSATSRKGAMGLGQLMPGTARGMGVANAYDSIDNLNGTVRLVRGHLEKYHAKTGNGFQSLVLALAAYNAGGGAVRRHGGVPPYRETQNYIVKVVGAYRALCGK